MHQNMPRRLLTDPKCLVVTPQKVVVTDLLLHYFQAKIFIKIPLPDPTFSARHMFFQKQTHKLLTSLMIFVVDLWFNYCTAC